MNRGIFCLFSLATLLSLAGLVGCGASSPEDTAVQFYHALETGDIDEVQKFAPPEERELSGEDRAMAVKMLALIKEAIREFDGIRHVKATNTEVEDDTARVEIEITFGNGEVENDTVHLRRSDGRWYVKSLDSLDAK